MGGNEPNFLAKRAQLQKPAVCCKQLLVGCRKKNTQDMYESLMVSIDFNSLLTTSFFNLRAISWEICFGHTISNYCFLLIKEVFDEKIFGRGNAPQTKNVCFVGCVSNIKPINFFVDVKKLICAHPWTRVFLKNIVPLAATCPKLPKNHPES